LAGSGQRRRDRQYVLGQTRLAETLPKGSVRLPNAAELFPEIIDPRLDAKDKLPSGSALEALESQSPFVNQILAYQALAMLARFFRHGKLTHHGGFANLATGRVSSLPIDPAVWHRIVNSGSPRPRARRKSRQRPDFRQVRERAIPGRQATVPV
jgi:hypothetical protein